MSAGCSVHLGSHRTSWFHLTGRPADGAAGQRPGPAAGCDRSCSCWRPHRVELVERVSPRIDGRCRDTRVSEWPVYSSKQRSAARNGECIWLDLLSKSFPYSGVDDGVRMHNRVGATGGESLVDSIIYRAFGSSERVARMGGRRGSRLWRWL